MVGNWYFHSSLETGREVTCPKHYQKRGAEQEGNFNFQTSIMPLFKTNLPLGAPGTSKVVSVGQGRKNQCISVMPWQAVGRATVWLQGLASQSQAVMIAMPPPLCLLPLLSPRDTGYDQHGKSLIIYFTCLSIGENPKTSR